MRFENGAVFDVKRAELHFSAPQKPKKPVNKQRELELQRIESGQRSEVGEYVAECDEARDEIVVHKGSQKLASRSRCGDLLAFRNDASELLLVMGDELHLWQPRTGQVRVLHVPALARHRPKWAELGSLHTLWVAVEAVPPESTTLLALDETNGRILFKKGLNTEIRNPKLGRSGSRDVLRASLGRDLVAWDVKTGQEVERWKNIRDYVPLAHGTMLALLGGEGVEFARVLPPERLATLEVFDQTKSALVTSPDGRFEILGDRPSTTLHLRCRTGHVVLPFSACTERAEWPGLLKERLGVGP